jgi:hypothetical protein
VSATGRGAVRREADFYGTPAWCVRRLLEACPLPGGLWLEPGAGEGAIIRAVRALRQDIVWTAVELRPEPVPKLAESLGGWEIGGRDTIITRDFLDRSTALGPFDVAIGNPPYNRAQEFVERAFEVADAVAFLLRLGFLSSRERQPFLARHTPSIYVLPDRPSFRGGGTDSTDYAWFVWRNPFVAGWPRVRILGLTGAEEKKRDAGQLGLFLPAEGS